MISPEIRQGLVQAFLRAGTPLNRAGLAEGGMEGADVEAAIEELLDDRLVVGLGPARPDPPLAWAARWQAELERRTAATMADLRRVVSAAGDVPDSELDVESPPSRAFCEFLATHYLPPEDKRILCLLQCSVRRPFSSSPSHASIRRAIRLATGFEPAAEFAQCPVHVVVVASKVGPVPYELQGCYPANVGGGGVKHFDADRYERVGPVLAARVADYLVAHSSVYDHAVGFGDGRYGEVMRCAATLARRELVVLPDERGERVIRMGRSHPRQYWQKYWIQVFRTIAQWLRPAERARAEGRLRSLDMETTAI